MDRRSVALGLSLLPLMPALAKAPPPAAAPSPLTVFLDSAFDEANALYPEAQTRLGLKTDYGRLDDYTETYERRWVELNETHVAQMRAQFDYARLPAPDQLSYRLFERYVAQAREGLRWWRHRFPVTNQFNTAGFIVIFLTTAHRVDSADDARAYVSRLIDVKRAVGEIAGTLMNQAKLGIVAPAYTFDPVEQDTRKLISGAPFDAGPDSPIWADFRGKIAALDIGEREKAALIDSARTALLGPYREGFERLLAAQAQIKPMAKAEAGAWSLPDGEAYYAFKIREQTTTDLAPDEVHKIGLVELDRIHREMRAIIAEVEFKGTLQAFFEHIKSDPKFHYPNTPDGKAAYLAASRQAVAEVMRVAPRYFSSLPEIPLEVRAVEPFREATAGVAFYQGPAPDGSRPGLYYVNLSDMRQVLKPQVEGLAFHEAAPGHHFQIARAMRLQGLPKNRRFLTYAAYTEGWGLYAERLGKEMGFYQDPYSDFGRLSLEAWRACRLVIDTGLHAKRWTVEQGVAFMRDNTLLSERDIRREVERYMVNPGQACAYKIGELRIRALRAKAEKALGARFDITRFHDAVLNDGALPMDLLESRVDDYLRAAQIQA